MNIKKFMKDVRGAALVYVIVAAAIIVMLGAATTATAYVNLRSTQIQEQADTNFYSADAVMNAIVSGLESDISIAYEAAYTQVITNLNTYGEDMEKAQDDFDTIFLNTLDSLLNDAVYNGGTSFKFMYDANHIQKYVQNVFKDDVSYTVTALNGDNFLDVTDTGIILRNLHVTYENDTGYYDEITTDVRIDIPQFDPKFIDNETLEINGIIIDDGLEIGKNSEYNDRGLIINGNVYINERESDHSAVLLRDKMTLSIIAPDEVIIGGDVKTQEYSEFIVKGDTDSLKQIKVWTENFDFGRYTTAKLIGLIFVDDDLEINGSNSNVIVSGEYYGYRKSSSTAAESSAIIINGANTMLDIQKLDTLVLGGSSYISTSTVPSGQSGKVNSTDIQTGEGLSVKSNQIAYLVDDKELNASIDKFVSNPMSYQQFNEMISSSKNGGNQTACLQKMAGIKMAAYGNKSYNDFGATIVPVFSNKDNGTVYLYLNFTDPDKAANYFVTAYRGNSLLSQRLRTYAAQYITSLQLNPNTDFLVNENFINARVDLYTEENIPGFANGLGYDQNKPAQEAMNNRLNTINEQYWGTADTVGEKNKIMYSEIISESQIEKFITMASAAQTDFNTNNKINMIPNGVIVTGTSDAKAIIVDNRGKAPYQLTTSGKGILIVTGDVEISADWLGTIICGGRAYVTGGAKVAPLDWTVDQTTIASVLPLYITKKTNSESVSMSVLNLFIGYENMSVNNATNNQGINADLISQCVTFSNWNRD